MLFQELIFSYHQRTRKFLQEYDFDNLSDYTVDSHTGCDIAILYRDIIEKVLERTFHVYADEISDGKYQVVLTFDTGVPFTLYSKAGYSKEDIADAIMDYVIRPYLRWHHLGDAS